MLLELPNISNGSAETQLDEIKSYIYNLNEQINLALADVTLEKQLKKIGSVLSTINKIGAEKSDIDFEKKKYLNTRDLIIKTADEVFSADEKYKKVFNGSYLAKSEFGNYLVNTKLEVLGSSKAVSELFTYAAQANEYSIFHKTDIRRGLLSDEGVVPPVYGLEIDLLSYEFLKDDGDNYVLDGDGHRIIEEIASDKAIRITPERISLMRNQSEIAYISEDAIYFPKAVITGGQLNINNNFIVDSLGNLTANTGTYKGSINVNNGAFKVTAQGVVTANSGTFKGSIDVNQSAFYVDNLGNLTANGTVNIGNGAFTVDAQGNLVTNSGTFKGSLNIGSGKVITDDSGYLEAKRAYLESAYFGISATTAGLYFSNDVSGQNHHLISPYETAGYIGIGYSVDSSISTSLEGILISIDTSNSTAKFLNINDYIVIQKANGYKAGSAGLYAKSGSSLYESFTGYKTIGSQTLHFVHGLLVN